MMWRWRGVADRLLGLLLTIPVMFVMLGAAIGWYSPSEWVRKATTIYEWGSRLVWRGAEEQRPHWLD